MLLTHTRAEQLNSLHWVRHNGPLSCPLDLREQIMSLSEAAVVNVVAKYKALHPLYEQLVEEVRYTLERRLNATTASIVSISGRVKEVRSLEDKIRRKPYQDPLTQITDLAGVRVVCNYESDLIDVSELIKTLFQIHEEIDKSSDLGIEKMGYSGRHLVVTLGGTYSGERYNEINSLKCEIQVRTVLQDAWAIISHKLIYKREATIPSRLRRDINNVASLLEIAQGVFDTVREKQEAYRIDIAQREGIASDFLAQSVDFETLLAYTKWKYPDLPVSEEWNEALVSDLDLDSYPTLGYIDAQVERAKAAVAEYRCENPRFFKFGTDFITKSMGFTDAHFRNKHAFGEQTVKAFEKYANLVRN
jgi:putative GTP pyrophosphokinase